MLSSISFGVMSVVANPPVRTSSLARLPPPSRAPASGAKEDSESGKQSYEIGQPNSGQAAATSAAGSGGTTSALPDALLSQISTLIDQKFAAARALHSLPPPTVGHPRARNNAPVGHGALHQLRVNAGLSSGSKEDGLADDNDVEDDGEGAIEDSNHFAALVSPTPTGKSVSALDGRIAAG